jgi:hypothetical protein
MADCPAAPLSKPSIWPARAPVAVHSGVWGVVSLSAIAAMDHGRRLMYALRLWPPPPTPLHITASRSPVTRFWVLVTEFDTLRCAPASCRLGTLSSALMLPPALLCCTAHRRTHPHLLSDP